MPRSLPAWCLEYAPWRYHIFSFLSYPEKARFSALAFRFLDPLVYTLSSWHPSTAEGEVVHSQQVSKGQWCLRHLSSFGEGTDATCGCCHHRHGVWWRDMEGLTVLLSICLVELETNPGMYSAQLLSAGTDAVLWSQGPFFLVEFGMPWGACVGTRPFFCGGWVVGHLHLSCLQNVLGQRTHGADWNLMTQNCCHFGLCSDH